MYIQTDSENELLHRVAAGDHNAFRQLFDEYWDNIYGVAFTLTKSREMARDLVQEIFVKLWLIRNELTEKESFRNFLFIVARNHIFSELRKKSRQEDLIGHLEAYFKESPFHADHQTLYKESASLLQRAIEQLPEQQRLVYTLSREEGWNQEQIAAHLQISRSTIKTHMSRALTAIRQYLESHARDLLLFICLINAFL
jgi:RNA polymerase sigma-70 factor (family 1)